jgi:hypothetical protein
MQTLTHYRPENAKRQVLIRRSDFLATPQQLNLSAFFLIPVSSFAACTPPALFYRFSIARFAP